MHIFEGLRLHKRINIPLLISVQPILVTIVISVVQSFQSDKILQIFGHLNVGSLVCALLCLSMMHIGTLWSFSVL
jgi:xanthine/uracil permease